MTEFQLPEPIEDFSEMPEPLPYPDSDKIAEDWERAHETGVNE